MSGTDWTQSLQEASWRNESFGVLGLEGKFGRATATHTYPFRDPIWVEDLGKAGRKLGIVGFLVGDDVIERAKAMIEAAEQEGEGQLVHPILGALTVSLIDFEDHWRHDAGGYVELSFTFLEAGGPTFPFAHENLAAGVEKAAAALNVSAASDFARSAGSALRQGIEAVREARRVAGQWIGTAQRLAGDVGSVLNAVGRIVPGANRSLGRFSAGLRNPLGQATRILGTVDRGVSAVGQAQRAVTSAATTVSRLVAKL